MDYCNIYEVKRDLDITEDTKDHVIQPLIEEAKIHIDNYCKREFDTTSETRYFDGSASPLFIDDLVSVTTLKLDEDGDGTFEATLTTDDYILYPLNDYPKTMVKVNPNGDYGGFASGIKKGVEINGSWGYASTVPKPIRRAAIMQVCRWFKRRESGYATVVGMPDIGTFEVHHGLDPDIKELLKVYVRRKV
ncbi:MAG: phage head-tail connector protein [Dehalococcoidales bacterium]|nr:phage head-tail connector protein [Dehalococcoidales bacterium]